MASRPQLRLTLEQFVTLLNEHGLEAFFRAVPAGSHPVTFGNSEPFPGDNGSNLIMYLGELEISTPEQMAAHGLTVQACQQIWEFCAEYRNGLKWYRSTN